MIGRLEPWKALVERAFANGARTPFYLFGWAPIRAALQDLHALDFGVPARHWLSLKTQPLPHLLAAWSSSYNGLVEVVSEHELTNVLSSGRPPNSVLVNGVAKHTWLAGFDAPGLTVQLDSSSELALLDQAHAQSWRLGLRLHTSQEWDPDEPSFRGQFGLTPDEAALVLGEIRKAGLRVDLLHFHLRSNVGNLTCYEIALGEVADFCAEAGLAPSTINIGGGLPAPDILVDHEMPRTTLDIEGYASVLRQSAKRFPTLEEYWLENGRFLLARSGVLVVTVIDVKDRRDCRYLICDGGRTNHALVSDWERHAIYLLPHRTGAPTLTTVCGPNCMAFDFLVRAPLPSDVQIGDHLLWGDAGAYHVPWETRFSRGLAQVLWCDPSGALIEARGGESADDWWRMWTLPADEGFTGVHSV